jgi:hypothetical protein
VNELDRKIREALGPEEAEALGPLGEPPLWEQVTKLFRGRKRWLNVLTVVRILAFVVFAVVSAVRFFQAEGLHEMIAWAGGFVLCLIAMTLGRIWLWMQVYTNAVLREVKRAHLQGCSSVAARGQAAGRLTAASGAIALGAVRRRRIGRMGVGIATDVALQEPGTEFVPQQVRTGLALQEGDELVLFSSRKHAVKGIVGGSEPLLPQLFPVRAGRRSCGGHEGVAPGW